MHGVTELCPECQFDPTTIGDDEFATRFETFAKRFPIPLTRLLANDDPEIVRRRPDPATWSAIEYVGHMVLMCEITTLAIGLVRGHDNPTLPNDNVDEAVAAAGFSTAPAAEVATRIAAAANATADALRPLSADDLAKSLTFDGFRIPLRLAVVAQIHEGHHHLLDVGRVMRSLRSR